MSHSKRNTSRAVFTSHERALAKSAWSSSSARLSRESFLPFASCWLCLEPAIDPVACSHGDIFCRECALSNILAQKQEIKRNERARGWEEKEALEDQTRKDLEAQERAIREFELTQAGLSIKRASGNKPDITLMPRTDSAGSPPVTEEEPKEDDAKANQKRKFSLDADEIARMAAEERAKLRKTIDEEKASKPTLPSFWSPTVTPSSNKNDTLHLVKKKIKTQPTCPASPEENPHPYSLHTLISINFTEEEGTNGSKTKEKHRICPACNKGLTNTSRATLAKPCGHVLCKSCVDKFVRPTDQHDPHAAETDPKGMRCYVCEASLVEGKNPSGGKKEKKAKEDKIKPGLVELRREGTGFSASGTNQIKKEGTSFAC
ncbi:hypothetical protein V8F06_002233 [Rhypophila decipiens]